MGLPKMEERAIAAGSEIPAAGGEGEEERVLHDEAATPAREPEVEEGLQQQAGERPVRAARRRRPDQPSAAEIETHEACGHEPYWSWCPDCVAGRGRADSHIQRSAGEKSLPVFGVDYGLLWHKSSGDDEAIADQEEEVEAEHFRARNLAMAVQV